jgi:O-antigen ligase
VPTKGNVNPVGTAHPTHQTKEIPTGRRKKAKAALSPEVPQAVGPGPEVLRRALLGAITALIVARPLVLGEDPGLLIGHLSDASNLWFSWLWLLVACGWALWRAWSPTATGQPGLALGSIIEIGLLGVVVLAFISAFGAAAYKHPAFLIAWEWFILLVAFFLVRQLVRTPGDNQRLLAAILASGVSLSVYAFYQAGVELPSLRDQVQAQVEQLQQDLARKGASPSQLEGAEASLIKRIGEHNAFATFAHPNSFAGYLALMLPAAVGGVLVCWRRQGWSWHTLVVAGGTLILGTGLLLTRSRGAILGVALVGASVWFARQSRTGRLVSLLGVLFLGGATIFGLRSGWLGEGGEGIDKFRNSMTKRLGYWSATWNMITDGKHLGQFWLGVGPGNFGRHYPRYMAETASEKITDPHNFALEIWATAGVFALAALLTALGAFFWKTRHVWTTPQQQDPKEERPPDSEIRFATRWEFYLGGMAGLILGFILSSFNQSRDQVLVNGFVAGGRAVVWFIMFALLETVPWNRPARALALTGGVAALLLNLAVSGGISFPSVAQPLWIMAALACNSLPSLSPEGGRSSNRAPFSRHWLGRVLPLPVAGAVCLLYFVVVVLPVSTSFGNLYALRNDYQIWIHELNEERRQDAEKEPESPSARVQEQRRFLQLQFLDFRILPTLRKARAADPGNAYPFLESANWYGERFRRTDDPMVAIEATRMAEQAVKLDPENKETYWTQYRLAILFAQAARSKAQDFRVLATQYLHEAVQRDPTEARLRFHYAEALFEAGEAVAGRAQAQEALRLDELSTEPFRKLTDADREKAKSRLKSVSN